MAVEERCVWPSLVLAIRTAWKGCDPQEIKREF